MASVRKTAGEGGPVREFKYSQEISQMVRSVTGKVLSAIPSNTQPLQDVRFWRGSGSKHGHP